MKLPAWKIACIILLGYTVVGGFLIKIPELPILEESIRNLFFHVPIWFAMVAIMGVSCWSSLKVLRNKEVQTHDLCATSAAQVGFLFGCLGIATGSFWAKFTWGAYWTPDPKLNASAIALFIYLAYFIFRSSIESTTRKATLSAVYNIFAFFSFIALIFIYPRISPNSLHPGNGGNPGFNSYDLDSNLRKVFYPACVAWILLSFWIYNILFRYRTIVNQKMVKGSFATSSN